MTQKDKVYAYIKNNGGMKTTNALRAFGAKEFLADTEKRARELFADGKLQRRWITEDEKQAWGYTTDVMVYFLPEERI